MLDAAKIYNASFSAGLRPDPELTVAEWADKYRMLPKKSSSEPGKYRSSRTPYAREIMDALTSASGIQEICVMKGTQLGFALSIDTPIPTPTGWKDMERIEIGDDVLDEKGDPCKVTYITEIMNNHQCYQVHFSDGNIIKCDADHIWTVWDYANKISGEYVRNIATIKTKQIYETFNEIHGRKRGRNRYGIDVTKPLNLPEINLPVDPYILGLWLGDGNRCSNRITTHVDDAAEMLSYILNKGIYGEIIEKHSKGKCVEIVLNKPHGECQRGHNLSEVGKLPHGTCRACHRIRSAKHKLPPIIYNSFQKSLQSINVFKNKHIPSLYLRASQEQRLELLQGLMDTDGHITKEGYCEWYSCDDKLTNNVMELLTTLGIKPKCKKKDGGKLCKIYDGKEYISKSINCVTFMSFIEMPVVKLNRKKARLKSINEARSSEVTQRRIINVIPCESFPVKCIQVDSESKLYLCGKGMIPTHNTEIGNNWFGYVVDISPGPMMMIFPTSELAQDHSKQKLQPTIQETPRLKDKIREHRQRDSGNTISTKEFPGGILFLSGSNSGAFFRSKSIRFLFLDDIDGFEHDIGGEGDPAELARKRTDTYGPRKKIMEVSTPTIKGVSRIEASFRESDQRYYHVPCPYCKTMQKLEWGGQGADFGLKFTREPNGKIKDVWYECRACHKPIEEHNKRKMLEHGQWIPEQPGKTKRGYQISSLYSPLGWVSWRQIIKEFLEAKDYKERLKTWVNTRLGEPFEETGEQPEWGLLKTRCEPYNILTVPAGGLILTAGIDTQDNRLAVVVRAWGRGEESWLILWTEIYGDPGQPQVWNDLDGLLGRSYLHASGAELRVISAAVDTGGHHASDVYNFARHKSPQVIAIKGASQPGKPIIGRPTPQDVLWNGQKIPNGVQLWPVGTDVAKGVIYSRLKIGKPGPGHYHFYMGVPDDYFVQLTAEKLVTRYIKGYPRQEWVMTGPRNEALDCEVYNYAAAIRIGIHTIDWDALTRTIFGGQQDVEKTEPKKREEKNKTNSRW